MINLEIQFTKLINRILKIVLPLIIIASTGMLFATMLSFNLGTIVFTIIILLSSFIIYKIINSNFSNKNKIYMILILAFIVRVLWILNSNTVPNSDFKIMYISASELLNGDTSYFKGIGYIARFPHLTITVLYMALMQYLFPFYNLLAMKAVNLFLGILSIFMIYQIVNIIFKDEKKSLVSLGIGCVFPPFITYTSVFCGENIAMAFYLLSIYCFLKSIYSNKNKYLYIIICGVTLGIGNLFRMVADVVLIAYILYLIIYSAENVSRKFKNIFCITISYFLILILVSGICQKSNITEYPLWRGSEPKITNVLKGTNIDHLGMWNKEDADMVENNLQDYNLLKEKSKKVIFERFTTTSPIKLSLFYVVKLCAQWCIGDFAGSFWSEKDVNDDDIIFKVGMFGSLGFQLFYIFILIVMFAGIKNRKDINSNKELNLFYLTFVGYIGAYLITEFQSRYGYIISWVFIILFVEGLNYIDLNKVRAHVNQLLWRKK